ncbi:MAG TPA: RNA polymerase-binding protein DksA [Burkholderiaceae bacterium]|nr:RNA polymerase-binding protein DksA [Burkholderiaceae bacterium]
MAAAKKSPARKAAKPVAKKATTTGAPKKPAAKKAPPKSAAKKAPAARGKAPVKKTAKVAPPRAAKPSKVTKAPPKAAPAKKASAAPAKSVSTPPAKKPQPTRPARNEKAVSGPVAAPTAAIAPLATASAAPKVTPAPSPKDLAAAHEYLLARSATRSEAPVMVNGKRLPSEGELLKMADSDYMNEQQLAFFKHRLQQMERELLQNADETTEHLRETVIVPDPADRATIEEEHALELRTRDRERKLLKKVQQALTRIDSGDYGYCEETGDPIGIPRLLARPTATLSLEAQQRREMKQKMYGD